MPSWLLLPLVILGMVVAVGLQAAAAMGNWRAFWTAARQFGAYLLALALAGVIVAGLAYIQS